MTIFCLISRVMRPTTAQNLEINTPSSRNTESFDPKKKGNEIPETSKVTPIFAPATNSKGSLKSLPAVIELTLHSFSETKGYFRLTLANE